MADSSSASLWCLLLYSTDFPHLLPFGCFQQLMVVACKAAGPQLCCWCLVQPLCLVHECWWLLLNSCACPCLQGLLLLLPLHAVGVIEHYCSSCRDCLHSFLPGDVPLSFTVSPTAKVCNVRMN